VSGIVRSHQRAAERPCFPNPIPNTQFQIQNDSNDHHDDDKFSGFLSPKSVRPITPTIPKSYSSRNNRNHFEMTVHEVTLHVYQLAPEGHAFFTGVLPSLGLGAYHTCIEIDQSRYTFAPKVGIVRSSIRHEHAPTGAVWKEAIVLGSCRLERGRVARIVRILQDRFFGQFAYHLVHRNCNHFTETMATALLCHDEVIQAAVSGNAETNDNALRPLDGALRTFPTYINRLANTSGHFVSYEANTIPCQVGQEAAHAVVASQDTSVEKASRSASTRTSALDTSANRTATKKVLTDRQKAALAKIRKTPA
jgi:hypothetical protein